MMLDSLARELRWWRVMHLSTNGLVRQVDRVETLTLTVLGMIAALGIIGGLMIGSNAFAEVQHAVKVEQQERHPVTATVLPRTPGAPVTARWTDTDGRVVTGRIDLADPRPLSSPSESQAAPGSTQTIWLDRSGTVVSEPRSETDALTTGLVATSLSIAVVAGIWYSLAWWVRRLVDRHRFRLWEQDWAALDSPTRR